MEKRNLPARVEMERAIDRAAARAAERYEENTVLRAAVASIPLLGGGLDMIFASEGQRAAKERMRKLIEAITERTVQLEEEAVNREYLESEEFIDLVMTAFDSATKTRDEEKIRWYARILTEATVRQKQGSYFPEEYLHLIADLTPLELRTARSFYESDLYKGGRKFPQEEAWTAWKEQTCKRLNIDRATLSMNMSRIAATGLIEPVNIGSDESGSWAYEGEPGDPSLYRVAPAFEKLMRFLEFNARA